MVKTIQLLRSVFRLTGHSEAVESYDKRKIDISDLLKCFGNVMTLLKRTGNDIGTQYRSAIYYTNEKF